jgi:1-acyl-sn-glycerol-3-phosphate acyltransferase
MTVFRSFAYQAYFCLLVPVLAILFLPSLVLPFWAISLVSRTWSRLVFVGLRVFAGLGFRIEGTENIPSHPVIFASKHQSAWDTMVFPLILKDPAIILKKELHLIPFYGWYAKRFGTIGIDRSGGASALRAMLRDARAAIENGRSIVVFPEGTRTARH